MTYASVAETPSFEDVGSTFAALASRYGVPGAIAGALWVEAWYPTEAAALGLPRLRQHALARIAVDAALESGDPERYRVARAHQRELERPEVDALVRHLSRNDSPSSEEVTALIERARKL